MPIAKLLFVLILAELALGGCLETSNENTLALFCPQDNCAAKLVQEFDNAEQSIDIAVYSFTNTEILEAVADASKRGVQVHVLMDAGQAESQYSVDERLLEKGIAVKLLEKDKGIMHHKFAVIDTSIVVTGSFNYSKNADKYNNENLVLIFDKDIADEFAEEFSRLWNAG